MTVLRVVMRPMQHRRPSRIMHELTARFDAVTRMYRHARRKVHIIDDLHVALLRIERELLVFALGMRSEEEARLGHYGSRQVGHARHHGAET